MTRNTKQKEEQDQEGKPPTDSDFGEIIATAKESEQSGTAVAQEKTENEDGAGADDGAGNDEGSSGQDAAADDDDDDTSGNADAPNGGDRPVEVASSAKIDSESGNDVAEEEDEVPGDVSNADGADDDEGVTEDQDGDMDTTDTQGGEEGGGNDDNDDDNSVSEKADATDTDANSQGKNDDDDDDEVKDTEDDEGTTAEVKEEKEEVAQSTDEALSETKENGATAEAVAKTTKPYTDVVRGPHKKSNEELDKLRGSHNRDKSTSALPVDDENAENASAKERAKGSPELDSSEQHKSYGPPASSSSPKGKQHHSSSPAQCSMLSLPCQVKAAFSSHPLSFVLVSATFVLLIIRRFRKRNLNNANARMDGRGEYAAIELLEGNFDDEMSFTGDDEDPDDIINSWRGDAGNSYVASGVGDDLDDVADGELSLSELNG